MDQDLQDAIAAALKLHEIGHGDPYRLSFAGKGNSGASFGGMQGDTSVQPLARGTLRNVLSVAGVPTQKIEDIMQILSRPAVTNPLSSEDDAVVTAALGSLAGRQLVDDMDRSILTGVIQSVNECIETGQSSGREIEPKAAIYMALWINMTGTPTTLKQWLSGHPVWLDHHTNLVPAPGPVVTAALVEGYLHSTDYYSANAGNFAHMQMAAAAGASVLT